MVSVVDEVGHGMGETLSVTLDPGRNTHDPEFLVFPHREGQLSIWVIAHSHDSLGVHLDHECLNTRAITSTLLQLDHGHIAIVQSYDGLVGHLAEVHADGLGVELVVPQTVQLVPLRELEHLDSAYRDDHTRLPVLLLLPGQLHVHQIRVHPAGDLGVTHDRQQEGVSDPVHGPHALEQVSVTLGQSGGHDLTLGGDALYLQELFHEVGIEHVPLADQTLQVGVQLFPPPDYVLFLLELAEPLGRQHWQVAHYLLELSG